MRPWWLLGALLLASPARAQTEPAPEDPAAAEALFQRAKAALERGEVDEACTLFRESNELDPAVGTLFNLADCEEQRGKTGTAWALFIEVRDRLAPGDERKALVDERIQKLEPRLSRLTVRLDAGAPAGTTLRRDGVLLGEASLGQPLVTDPGPQTIVVQAEGHETRTFEVVVPDAGVAELDVAAGPALPETAPTSEPTTSGPVGLRTSDEESTSLHPYGLTLLGVGVVGIGVGVGLGVAAKGRYDDAEPSCPDNVCDQGGFDQRQDAITLSHIGTGVLLAGAAIAATGAVLEIVELTDDDAEPATATLVPSTVAPWMGPDGRGWSAGLTGGWTF